MRRQNVKYYSWQWQEGMRARRRDGRTGKPRTRSISILKSPSVRKDTKSCVPMQIVCVSPVFMHRNPLKGKQRREFIHFCFFKSRCTFFMLSILRPGCQSCLLRTFTQEHKILKNMEHQHQLFNKTPLCVLFNKQLHISGALQSQ